MEFSVSRELLLKGLSRIQGIVDKRSSMPILSNALLSLQGNGLSISATDLELWVSGHYPVSGKKDGNLTVGAKQLFDIVRKLPDGLVQINRLDNDWVELTQGDIYYKLVGLSAAEFPAAPTYKQEGKIIIGSGTIRAAIQKTSYAMSQDEMRFSLNGIYLEKTEEEKKIRFVATDGHRLAYLDAVLEKPTTENLGIIIPKKAILELKKLCEEEEQILTLFVGDGVLAAKKEGIEFIVRLVDGSFPDYRKVIPKNNDKLISIDRKGLIASFDRVSTLSTEKIKGTRLSIKPERLELSVNTPEAGEAKEAIAIAYNGKPIEITFNARYMIDVLSVLDTDRIELRLGTEHDPALILPDKQADTLSVIMPMRM